MKLLITGCTGYLGKYVIDLLDSKKISWKGISRSGEFGYKGDLRRLDLGLNISSLKRQKFTHFLHMGAIYDLQASRELIRLTNITGTQFAMTVARKLNIESFINISSIAAVINGDKNTVREDDIFEFKPFPDAYSESKARAELIAQRWGSHFKSLINIRLGVLVGDTKEGMISRLDGPYLIPKAFSKLKNEIYRSPFPVPVFGMGDIRLPLLPVDIAAESILRLLSAEFEGYKSFHLVPKNKVKISELYRDSLGFVGLGHKKIVSVAALPRFLQKEMAKFLAKFPEEEMNYLLNMPNFSIKNTNKALGSDWCPSYSSYKQAFWSGYEKFIQGR